MASKGAREPAATVGREATGEAETESRLVARAAAGDVDAFEVLVREHSSRLYGVLLRVTANSADAEDALQETFVRAWRAIPRFEGRSSFFTWLYRIGLNEARRRIDRRPPPQVVAMEDAAQVEQIRDRGPAPDVRAEQRELLAALEGAVRRLEPDHRAPLVLRDIEGLSTREAATILGLGEAAFKSRLHRARMALRGLVDPILEPGEGS